MKRTVWFNIVTMILWAAAALFGPGTCTSVLAVEGTTPLYSFYNPTEHDHFLTASYDEEEQLRLFCDPAHRYVYEGICWRVETRPDRDTVPVYRFYNDLTKDHFFKCRGINIISQNTTSPYAIIASTKTSMLLSGTPVDFSSL